MKYSKNHRHEDVVLAGNGPVMFQSIPAPGPAHGLVAEQATLLQSAYDEQGPARRTARPRSRRVVGSVWQGLRSRLVHSPA